MDAQDARTEIDESVLNFTASTMRIQDAVVRRHYVAQRLAEMDDIAIADVLHRLLELAMTGNESCKLVVSTALDMRLFSEQIGKLRVGRIFHEANRKQYHQVCNLFRTIKPVKEAAGDENLFEQYGLSNVTLGERKSLARSHDRDVLNRVGYDLDGAVINQLLQNPRLTESDVITIAARRPNSPEVLEEIFRAPKWLSRREVKIALIRNPYMPPQLAISLVPSLLKQDLRDVMNDSSIHESVRDAARRALELKKKASLRSRTDMKNESDSQG